MDQPKVFGPHLILDLEDCSQNKLSDLRSIFFLLESVPDKIGMTRITQPYVFPYSGLVPEDRGITGTVIIAESHISIHAFELKRYCFVDIFSCKPFDTQKCIELFTEHFESKSPKSVIIDRGVNFPR